MSHPSPLSVAEAIAHNVAAVQAEIEAACRRAGRQPHEVKLVAVSKQRALQEMLAALQAGISHLGENRVEEAIPKIPALMELLPPGLLPPTWHMVGHVQSRKARPVVEQFEVIHSLDSLKLAQRYHNFAQEQGKTPQVLLEVNISGESSKEGNPAYRWQNDAGQRQNLWNIVQEITALAQIHVVGLMTMAPYVDDVEQIRPVFATLRRLRDALANDFPQSEWPELSMGMTNDYPVAVEEGATMVRIGRAIFGEFGA
jgi:pyridoxal phosphate enzyme (YggS family)